MNGNTRLLATFDTETNGTYNWDLSQDGNEIAIAKVGSHQIYLLALNGSPRREITWSGSSGWSGLDWSTDGTGIFVSRALGFFRTSLYFVSLNGTAHLLWDQRSLQTWGISSPDARHIALLGQEFNGNMWMVEHVSAEVRTSIP
jgi:Tol biopolymer transport system component